MRDELEAQLMAERRRVRREAMLGETDLDRGELEALLDVYGDRLQEAGDPRGEAIALRHTDAPPRWLGELGGHPQVEARDGFVQVRVDGSNPALLRDVLAGAGAPYLEHVWITDGPDGVRAQLEVLASREHPWLGALSIAIVERDRPATVPRFPTGLVDRVVRATPNLEFLGMYGANYIAPFRHPSLVKLAINGSANAAALTRGSVLPEVVAVDLAIYTHDPLAWESIESLLPRASLPKLAILDLSRNRPEIPAYRFLAHCATQHDLALVNLPPLRTRTDADDLSRALTAMPSLEYLKVATNDGDPRTFRHPTAELAIGQFRPWAARKGLGNALLTLELPTTTHELRAAEAVIALERVFVDLPPVARAIWTDLWTSIRTTGRARLSTAALYVALAACGDFLLDDAWRALRRELGTTPDGDASLRWLADP